jgi:LacI family transcriptional regulator
MRKVVTAKDVADLAGVSKWIVIRTFREGASVSSEKRVKVEEAAKVLNYRPNLLARSLATNRTQQIGILVDDFSNPYKWSFLERFTEEAQERGLVTVLINLNSNFNHVSAVLDAAQRQLDAIVLFDTAFRDEIIKDMQMGEHLPPLYVLAREGQFPDVPSVLCDSEQAMKEIVEHLAGKGYKRPAFLSGTETLQLGLGRALYFQQSWASRNVGVVATIMAGSYRVESGADAMRCFLNRTPAMLRPDIIMCENDVLAVGAMDVARSEFGMRVPQDMAFVGFDNIPLAAAPSYALTTYEQPRDQMIGRILDMIGGQATKHSTRLRGRLIERSST